MRRLFALILSAFLLFSFAPSASADGGVGSLVPCKDSPAFINRAKNASSEKAKERFQFYGEQLLCGPEGLPHLVVDGRWSRAGDFLIPSILFLYIAGWIGWVGRKYIIAARESKNPYDKEIIIDVPLAVRLSVGGFIWPLEAIKQMLSGEMFAKDDEIPVSPR